jgi:hypothetical protein
MNPCHEYLNNLTRRQFFAGAGLAMGGVALNLIAPKLRGAGVSRAHCLVEFAADQLRVTDLNSTNGTYIDNKRIERSELFPVGSVLRVGNVSFEHEVRPKSEVRSADVPVDFDDDAPPRGAKVANARISVGFTELLRGRLHH